MNYLLGIYFLDLIQISYLEIEEEVQNILHRQTSFRNSANGLLSWSVKLAFGIPQYSEHAQLSCIIIKCSCLFLREYCSPGKTDALRLNGITSFIIYAHGITQKFPRTKFCSISYHLHGYVTFVVLWNMTVIRQFSLYWYNDSFRNPRVKVYHPQGFKYKMCLLISFLF